MVKCSKRLFKIYVSSLADGIEISVNKNTMFETVRYTDKNDCVVAEMVVNLFES